MKVRLSKSAELPMWWITQRQVVWNAATIGIFCILYLYFEFCILYFVFCINAEVTDSTETSSLERCRNCDWQHGCPKVFHTLFLFLGFFKNYHCCFSHHQAQYLSMASISGLKFFQGKPNTNWVQFGSSFDLASLTSFLFLSETCFEYFQFYWLFWFYI